MIRKSGLGCVQLSTRQQKKLRNYGKLRQSFLFSEDLRELPFASLENPRRPLTEEQLDAVDELIDRGVYFFIFNIPRPPPLQPTMFIYLPKQYFDIWLISFFEFIPQMAK